MNRRDFLAAIGVGAVELCVFTRALPSVAASSIAHSPMERAVWLKHFHGKSTSTLIRSRKFRTFMEHQFEGVRAPFHGNMRLWAPIWSYMNRPSETPVTIHHHRYLIASGSMAHCGSCRAMMWIDTKSGRSRPLAVIAFMRGPHHELWITCNDALAGSSPYELPHHMTMSISRWLRERRPLFSDGGYLKRLIIYDQTPEDVEPLASAWGVKPYRCTFDLVTKSIPTQATLQ